MNPVAGSIRVFIRVILTSVIATSAIAAGIYLILAFGVQYFGINALQDLADILVPTYQPVEAWLCEGMPQINALIGQRFFSLGGQAIYFGTVVAGPFLLVWGFALALRMLRNRYVPEMRLFWRSKTVLVLGLFAILAAAYLTAPDWIEQASGGEISKVLDNHNVRQIRNTFQSPQCPDAKPFLTDRMVITSVVMFFAGFALFPAAALLGFMFAGRYFPVFNDARAGRWVQITGASRRQFSPKDPVRIGKGSGLAVLVMLVAILILAATLSLAISDIEVPQDPFHNLPAITDATIQEMDADLGDTVNDLSVFLNAFIPRVAQEPFAWNLFGLLMITGKGIVVLFLLVSLVSLRFFIRFEAAKRSFGARFANAPPPSEPAHSVSRLR